MGEGEAYLRKAVTTAMSRRGTPAWIATRDLRRGWCVSGWTGGGLGGVDARLQRVAHAQPGQDRVADLLVEAGVRVERREEAEPDGPEEPADEDVFLEGR